jgi:hypothetical protein
MNPRKLMGRLNASTVRFDIGRGGIPEITQQDIAASLAYVDDKVEREIFCAVWAPELARLSRSELLAHLRAHVLKEYAARHQAAAILKLELHILESNQAAKLARTHADQRALEGLRAELRVAKARCWPAEPAVYPRICAAVIAELAGAMQCGKCHGRGFVMVDNLREVCDCCGGHGLASATDAQRARWIGKSSDDGRGGVDSSSYRHTWRPVYEWVRDQAAAKEKEAATKIAAALAREEAA